MATEKKTKAQLREDMRKAPFLSKQGLRDIGFKEFDTVKRKSLMLIPGEYYPYIKHNQKVYNLAFEPENFQKKTHDDGTTFGVLAYGFLVDDMKTKPKK